MRQFSRRLQRVVDVIDGPYRGQVVRIALDAQIVWIRPPEATAPRERYAVVDIGLGVRELRYAPLPPDRAHLALA